MLSAKAIGVSEAVPKRRYKGRSDFSYTPLPWEQVYLATLGKHGNAAKAAQIAGVTPRIVKARREAFPEFNQLWAEAMDGYLDKIEEELGDLKNPIAKIARLRADRPERYLEKHQLAVAGTILNAHFTPKEDEVNALLAVMLKSMAPETREMIEATATALPESVDTADSPDH